MLDVVVLASGEGTNLQALIDGQTGSDDGSEQSSGFRIRAVITDNADAAALDRAAEAGIQTFVAAKDQYPSRLERDLWIADRLNELGITANSGLVVLAGYMAILSPEFVERFPQRIINVHPSLLPAFPGLDAIGQAWRQGVQVYGVTVHFVDSGVDTGVIIRQSALEITDVEGPEQLHTLLRPLEHQLLIQAVHLFASGGLKLDTSNPRRVKFDQAQ